MKVSLNYNHVSPGPFGQASVLSVISLPISFRWACIYPRLLLFFCINLFNPCYPYPFRSGGRDSILFFFVTKYLKLHQTNYRLIILRGNIQPITF